MKKIRYASGLDLLYEPYFLTMEYDDDTLNFFNIESGQWLFSIIRSKNEFFIDYSSHYVKNYPEILEQALIDFKKIYYIMSNFYAAN